MDCSSIRGVGISLSDRMLVRFVTPIRRARTHFRSLERFKSFSTENVTPSCGMDKGSYRRTRDIENFWLSRTFQRLLLLNPVHLLGCTNTTTSRVSRVGSSSKLKHLHVWLLQHSYPGIQQPRVILESAIREC
jgi:hypothetical protein